ncbi:MAG TPA: homocysteine S-methyltransferase family protein [Steroidobacteraceae bacterium]|nr:homocysteine S-methyltransferase family protein [Steroidobacteraceae bacterium]
MAPAVGTASGRTARITLLDGGTGRELMRIGAPFRQPEWSALALIEAPEFVTRVHRAYVEAGADVITTNSYAIVPFHIGTARFASDGARLAALAGRLARDVADAASRPVRVAGSLPPVCGSYRADWFDPEFARPVLATLVDGLRPAIDHWQAETLSAIAEAELVREVLGRDPRPLWLSFTLRDEHATPGRPLLRSGEPVGAAVSAAIRLGAAAVLFNCSQPEVMGDAVDKARDGLTPAGRVGDCGIPVGVYANAFVPQRADAEANSGFSMIRADLTPEGYRGWVEDWLERGATIVGGCCGIGPEHIRALREALGSW